MSTPIVAEGSNRASVVGKVQDFDEDESVYTESTSKSSRTHAAPASFSQPQPGQRNFRNSLTNSTAYPATINSRRTTAAPLPPPAFGALPQIPTYPQNAASTSTRYATGTTSPQEISPMLNRGRGSPASDIMVSPVDRNPIRRALAAITEDRGQPNAYRPTHSPSDPLSSSTTSPSPHQYRVDLPRHAAQKFPSPYGQIYESPLSSSRPSPVQEERDAYRMTDARGISSFFFWFHRRALLTCQTHSSISTPPASRT